MNSLAESITETLDQQSERALELTDEFREVDAAAILNEWVLPTDNKCLLTEYLNETTATVQDRLLYATIDENGAIAGEFYFVAEPIDNN